MTSPKKTNPRHEHSPENLAPGASGPGQQGYDGEATVGDEGAAAGPEAFFDPTGTGREGGPEIAADLEHELEQRRKK